MSKVEKRKAFSVKVLPSLWKEAKVEAAKHDTTISELVESGLRDHLRKLRGYA
jgi:hypothetical protein